MRAGSDFRFHRVPLDRCPAQWESLGQAGSSGSRQERASSLPCPAPARAPSSPTSLVPLGSQLLAALLTLPAHQPPSLLLFPGVTHFPKTNGSFFPPIHHCSWAHPLAAAPLSCPQPHVLAQGRGPLIRGPSAACHILAALITGDRAVAGQASLRPRER